MRKSVVSGSLALAASFLLSARDGWSQPAPAAAAKATVKAEATEKSEAKENTEKAEATEKAEKAVEISVVGTRVTQTSGSAHVIKSKQLERLRYDDPHAVLVGVPGVYVRGEDGFGLRPNIGMRGASSDRSKKITLMEDNVLFGPAPYSAPAAYYFPLIQRMQSVAVVKGPAAISFGPQTVGGAINFVTRAIPVGAAGSADLSYGQYGYRKAHATYGYGDDRVGFLIEGIHIANNGFKELDGGGDTGFTRNEWMLKGRYVLDPNAWVVNQFEVKLGYSDEDSNETYLGLTDADFRENPLRRYRATRLDRMKWHRTQLSLTHRAFLQANLEVATTVYRHDLTRVWRKVNGLRGADLSEVLADPESPRNSVFAGVVRGDIDATTSGEAILIGPNERSFVSQGVQSVLRWSPTTGPIQHRFEYGVRLHYDAINRRHTEDGFLMAGGELTPDGRVTALNAENAASTYAIAHHVIDAISWGALTVTPGVRVELIKSRADDTLTKTVAVAEHMVALPGIGVYYGILPSLSVLAGVYKGFSPPPPGDVGGAAPEESYNYEAGVRYNRRGFRAEAIGFYNDYKNLTSVCTFSSGCQDKDIDRQFDAGQARTYGLEAYVESELKTDSGLAFPGRIAYTLTQTEFLSDFRSGDPQFGDVKIGDQIPYVPAHQISASAGVETARWGVTLNGTFVDRMRENAGQGDLKDGETTDAYFLFDANAHFRIWKFLDVYANGRNLLDATYLVSRRPFGARPGAPRWIQMGVKAEF